MTLVVYSLEDTINDFFASHPKVTQLQCDQLAISLVGGPVSPVPIQGSFSYTVVAGSQQPKIVQFRDANPDLDTEILNRARQVYGKFVADYSFHGKIGESLSVYVMEKLPGVPYVSVRFQYTSFDGMSSAKGPEHSNIVTDYAMFFAASWKGRQHLAQGETQAIFDEVSVKTRVPFSSATVSLSGKPGYGPRRAPVAICTDMSLSLNHGDLCGMNFLVDPSAGHLTGVIDWAEAQISPFGISLWGLENVLGYMNSQGWHYHTDHRSLRDLFWQIFEENVGGLSDEDRQSIRVARMADLFFRYGFSWDGDNNRQPVEEGTPSFKYLDAFCAAGN